jgi:hypothetical protein
MGSLSISSCIAPFVSTSISDQTIYLVYLALAIVHFLYCLVFVPETLPADFQPTGPLSINPLKICSILNRYASFLKSLSPRLVDHVEIHVKSDSRCFASWAVWCCCHSWCCRALETSTTATRARVSTSPRFFSIVLFGMSIPILNFARHFSGGQCACF